MTKHFSHEQPVQGTGRALLFSLVGHVLFFSALLLLASWVQPALLELGGGPGGGQGGAIISVGLTDQLSGGAGMVKPGLTPQPQAAPPAPTPAAPAAKPQPPAPEGRVFEIEEKTSEKARPKRADPAPKPSQPAPGVIPQEPRPGSGGSPSSGPGSGGGFGSGVGVEVGGGSGGSGLDSWYLRQVERRISQNWLRSSLGQPEVRVEVAVSFEIESSGRIDSVTVLRSSGRRSVDLSAERAVRASNPLPPLPPEFRRGRVRFVAKFEYPPR